MTVGWGCHGSADKARKILDVVGDLKNRASAGVVVFTTTSPEHILFSLAMSSAFSHAFTIRLSCSSMRRSIVG